MTTSVAQPDPAFEKRVYNKVTWHLIPFLFLCYIFAYLDRVNVGFAKLQMQQDLNLSSKVFGFDVGAFFIGYLLFQVPCNIALQKIGAKYWLGPIMIVWGVVSACTLFATGHKSFLAFRVALGIVESGFFPGVILYLTFWYPSRYRAKMVAAFMTAIPISGLVGGPISGWILKLTSNFGRLHGWQWLYLFEAIPSVIAGFVAMRFLNDSPAKSTWLTDEERSLLTRRLEEDDAARKRIITDKSKSLAGVVLSPYVWLFGLIYFGSAAGNYGLQFWLPQIIHDTLSTDPVQIGWYSTIPWGITAIVMVLVGHNSDKTGERAWHQALSVGAGGLGLAISAIPGIPGIVGLLALTIGAAGVVSASANLWSLPPLYLSGAVASAGIAMINSLGNLGGQFAPFWIGFVRDHTQNITIALLTLAGLCWLSAAITLTFFRKRRSPVAH